MPHLLPAILRSLHPTAGPGGSNSSPGRFSYETVQCTCTAGLGSDEMSRAVLLQPPLGTLVPARSSAPPPHSDMPLGCYFTFSLSMLPYLLCPVGSTVWLDEGTPPTDAPQVQVSFSQEREGPLSTGGSEVSLPQDSARVWPSSCHLRAGQHGDRARARGQGQAGGGRRVASSPERSHPPHYC